MPRERVYKIIERTIKQDGKLVTSIYARTSYTDRQGNRHTLWRSGETRTEAKTRLKAALEDVLKDESATSSVKNTFADLVSFYKERYVKAAVYQGDIKISGTRAPEKVLSNLKPIIKFFGKMRLRAITYDDIARYKAARLATPYTRGTDAKGEPRVRERAVSSVNRELALIRKMLNVAASQGWIALNPFTRGDGLISEAGEVKRQRILTDEEEARIFEACGKDERRAHLKPVLLCLIDTGMRRNEVLRLVWADVDFEEGLIRAVSFKGKKRSERPVPMSQRLEAELKGLRARSTARPQDLVFGITHDIKRSWMTVRKLAKLEDVRLHDLRHQAATNFIRSGLSLEETGKILGHAEPKTTWRYVNINRDSIKRARENLDRFHKKD